MASLIAINFSGELYESKWEKSMRNGYGVLYDPDGNVQVEGECKDDKLVRVVNACVRPF